MALNIQTLLSRLFRISLYLSIGMMLAGTILQHTKVETGEFVLRGGFYILIISPLLGLALTAFYGYSRGRKKLFLNSIAITAIILVSILMILFSKGS